MFTVMLTQFNGMETEMCDLGTLSEDCNTVRKAINFAFQKTKDLNEGWANVNIFDNMGLLATCNLLANAQYGEPKYIQMIGNDLIGIDTEIAIDDNFFASFGLSMSPYTVGIEFGFDDGSDFNVTVDSSAVNVRSECKKWQLCTKAGRVKRVTASKTTLQLIGLLQISC